jgi:hypothetical protein
MNLRGLSFKVFHMPVVPVYVEGKTKFDMPERLARAGFKVTPVGDAYLVLENQYLLAFDHKEMGIDVGVRKVKGKFKVMHRSGPKEEIARTEATTKILDLLDQINDASNGTRYSLASTTFVPNPRNANIWFAWIVTEHQRKILALHLNTIEVEWDLPFSHNIKTHEDE